MLNNYFKIVAATPRREVVWPVRLRPLRAAQRENDALSRLVWVVPFDDTSPAAIADAQSAVEILSAAIACQLGSFHGALVSTWRPFHGSRLPHVGVTGGKHG